MGEKRRSFILNPIFWVIVLIIGAGVWGFLSNL
ncbi:hypothetical protein SAMN05216225_102418 [Ornithinibacillus halophilus]|uniref:Uncharacterized protein n=1 Tax=Ornithinibacillus halophilus TaxID=930117 RepID=A0A1M5IIY7_9BACI|nr:hypothetical protein SAMN05216225_102418 [Ornithinibacillus halophilus]